VVGERGAERRGHHVVVYGDLEAVAGVPLLAAVFFDRVRGKHHDRLEKQRDGSDARDALAARSAPERVDRPPLAERGHERDDDQHPEQPVAAVEHRRIPSLKRDEQHERDETDEPRPVADEKRHGERPGDDEQELLKPEFAGERVERRAGVAGVGGLVSGHRIDARVGVKQLESPCPETQVDEQDYPERDPKDRERPGVDLEPSSDSVANPGQPRPFDLAGSRIVGVGGVW